MPRKKTVETRLITRQFYLDGGVEITVKSPEGAVRLQCTHNALSLSTGTEDNLLRPTFGNQTGAGAHAGAPASQESWSNCDTRGIGAVAGTGDPVKALSGDLISAAAATGAEVADVKAAAQFLDRLESNAIASEVTEGELEAEIIEGGEIADA